MKFKTSTLALSATLAAGLASSAFADATPTATPTPTPYANLAFKTNQTYTVTVNGTTQTPSNGAWSGSQVVVENSAIVIDSDSTEPLTFTPDAITDEAKKTCDATELDFNVEASFVPATVNLAAGDDARCGFAIKLAADPVATNYWLYNGGEWTQSASPVAVESGEMFDLKVRLDFRSDVKKATYFVKGVNIGETALTATNPVAVIDFVGNGSLKSLRGDRLAIVSEKIEINPGSGSVTLVIEEESLKEIRKAAKEKDIGTYLAEPVTVIGNGMTRLDAQVLFGTTDPTTDNKAVVKGAPKEASEGKVRVNIEGLTDKQVGGATIKYQLQGSTTGAAEDSAWHDIGGEVTDVTKLEFDQNTTDRFIRVKTSVSYGNAQ